MANVSIAPREALQQSKSLGLRVDRASRPEDISDPDGAAQL
jgi:hypothetical protein